MFKLSKSDLIERSGMIHSASTKLTVLNDAIDKYNATLEDIWREVEDAMNDFNGALEDTRNFVERLRDEFTDEFDNKSDKWQEGDKASAVRDWIDSFESVELDDVELDEPEPFSNVSVDGLETLENLETEPNF